MSTPPAASATTPAARPSAIDRFLTVVERGGNALPHPATLFAILALLVIVLVIWLFWAWGWGARDARQPAVEPEAAPEVAPVEPQTGSLPELPGVFGSPAARAA